MDGGGLPRSHTVLLRFLLLQLDRNRNQEAAVGVSPTAPMAGSNSNRAGG